MKAILSFSYFQNETATEIHHIKTHVSNKTRLPCPESSAVAVVQGPSQPGLMERDLWNIHESY